jgi:hypothetical protein
VILTFRATIGTVVRARSGSTKKKSPRPNQNEGDAQTQSDGGRVGSEATNAPRLARDCLGNRIGVRRRPPGGEL